MADKLYYFCSFHMDVMEYKSKDGEVLKFTPAYRSAVFSPMTKDQIITQGCTVH